jgi:hypothetical protein
VEQLLLGRGVGDLERRGRFEGKEDGEGGEAADGEVDVEAPEVGVSARVSMTGGIMSLALQHEKHKTTILLTHHLQVVALVSPPPMSGPRTAEMP